MWLLVRRRGRDVAFGLGVTSFESSSLIFISRFAIFFIPASFLASSASLALPAALLLASICALVRRFSFQLVEAPQDAQLHSWGKFHVEIG